MKPAKRLSSGWTDRERIDEPPTTWRGAITIQGIAANAPIMAVGRLLPKDGQLSFRADSVVGVSRADYVQRLVEDRARGWELTGIYAVIAVLGLYGGWRGARRVMS